MDIQFIHQPLAMGLDGLGAEVELGGDLFVGLALRNQLKHLGFA